MITNLILKMDMENQNSFLKNKCITALASIFFIENQSKYEPDRYHLINGYINGTNKELIIGKKVR